MKWVVLGGAIARRNGEKSEETQVEQEFKGATTKLLLTLDIADYTS